MAKFPVLSTLIHDGETLDPGATVDLDPEAAATETLIAAGAIGAEPVADEKPAKGKKADATA